MKTKRDELIEEYFKLFEERGITDHTRGVIISFISLIEWYELRDATSDLFRDLCDTFLESIEND